MSKFATRELGRKSAKVTPAAHELPGGSRDGGFTLYTGRCDGV